MPRQTYKVIAVDDEPHVLEGLQYMMDWSAYGFELIGCYESGKEALVRIEEGDIHLLITDVRMPDIDGLSLVEQALERQPQIEVLIMSGYRDFDYVKRAMQLGASNYLVKPIFEEDLHPILEQVNKALNEKIQTQAIGLEGQLLELRHYLMDQQGQARGLSSALVDFFATSFNQSYWSLVTLFEAQHYDGIEAIEEELLNRDSLVGLILEANTYKRIYLVPYYEEEIEEIIEGVYLEEPIIKGLEVTTLMSLKKEVQAYREGLSCHLKKMDHPYDHVYWEDHLAESVVRFERALIRRRLYQLVEQVEQAPLSARDQYKWLLEYYERLVRRLLVDEGEEEVLGRCLCLSQEVYRIDLSRLTQAIEEHLFFIEAYLKEAKINQQEGVCAQITDYMKTHYKESVTIKGLAQQVHMHPAYLGQKIQQIYGESFHKVLHRLRYEEARRLLEAGQVSMEWIALEVGYSQYAQFLKYFKKYSGTTPKKYGKSIDC